MRELGNEKISKWVVIKMVFDRSGLSDKLDWFGFSEGNGIFQKEAKRFFDEKRV